MGFLIVEEKRIGREKYTRQSNVRWSLISHIISKGHFGLLMTTGLYNFVERTVRINTAIWICDQYFKLSGLFTTQIFYIQLYREVWNARCDYFLVDIQEHDFFVRCIWRSRFCSSYSRFLYKFFFTWGLLSGEDTDDGRRRLILSYLDAKNRAELPHFFLGRSETTGNVQRRWIFSYHKTDKLDSIGNPEPSSLDSSSSSSWTSSWTSS